MRPRSGNKFLAVGGAGAATDTLRGEMDVLVSRLGSDVSIESVEATGSQGAARAKYRVYSTEAKAARRDASALECNMTSGTVVSQFEIAPEAPQPVVRFTH